MGTCKRCEAVMGDVSSTTGLCPPCNDSDVRELKERIAELERENRLLRALMAMREQDEFRRLSDIAAGFAMLNGIVEAPQDSGKQ